MMPMLVVSAETVAVWDEGMPPVLSALRTSTFFSIISWKKIFSTWAVKNPRNAEMRGILPDRSAIVEKVYTSGGEPVNPQFL